MLAAVKTALSQQTSRNWAGYVVNSSGITGISASWVVPEIQCGSMVSTEPLTAGVSVWIGIDGLGTAVPEQLGTDSFCVNGSPSYEAWEEDPTLTSGAMPAFSREISDGDHITASIAYLGNRHFRLYIKDAQTGDSRTYNVIFPNTARASAEWIVEDPWNMNTGKYLNLPTFQPVTFNDCSAAVNNVTGSLVQNNAQPISMADSNGNIIVTPQNVNQAGTSFQVAEVGTPVPEAPSILGLLLPAFTAVILILWRKSLPKNRLRHSFVLCASTFAVAGSFASAFKSVQVH